MLTRPVRFTAPVVVAFTRPPFPIQYVSQRPILALTIL
jgi:hypothetical protein